MFSIICLPHHYPDVDFYFSHQVLNCPNLHRSYFPKYVTHVAVPLLKDNGNFKLSEQDLNNLILCLKKALKFLNVEVALL